MAFHLGGMNQRGRRGAPALSEINVTPFVDVALVLLIIFMITAHAMESGIEIDVPKTTSVATTAKDLPAIVSLTKDGELYLGKNPVKLAELAEAIHTRYPGQTAVYLKADREATMDLGVSVMDVLARAKFGVNVVTQPDERRR